MRADMLDCPVLPFAPKRSAYPTEHTTAICSPSRVWSDLFWISLDREALCAVLGPLHLLEIGRGAGRYFDLYDESFGGLARYTGLDPLPRDSWRSDRPRRSFRQSTAEYISPEPIKATHLTPPQSAIAPTPDDPRVTRDPGQN